MLKPLAAALLAAALAAPALVRAETPQISVRIGPELERHAADYGERELRDLSDELADDVRHALAHPHAPPPARVDLVIEDAVPNRPTMSQLGRSPGLSYRSIGLGGARISGTATYPDGSVRPIREQWFETDLADVRGADTWYDARRAFDRLGYDLARGHVPDRFEGPGPSGNGHFGYPLTR